MRRVTVTTGSRKKPRESRRSIQRFQEWSVAHPRTFPEPGTGGDLWYCNIPVPSLVVDGKNARRWARRAVVSGLIHAQARLARMRPSNREAARIIACITLPELFRSSINVVFTEQRWERMLQCDEPGRSLRPLSSDRSLLGEWDLLPATVGELGFLETIREGDYRYDGELWFVGNVMSHPSCESDEDG